jgi:alkylation response protein AidB-like acyl-CoA dehydrogenase
MSHHDVSAPLEAVAAVAAEHAAAVDREGRFPRESLDAAAREGLLGLVSAAEVGGMGHGLRDAATVVERLGRACGSTAMVVCMHYAATLVIERFGDDATRRAIAAGRHLSTLAFSEAGSRSMFWAPVSTATKTPEGVRLDAKKSWVTSAHAAQSYVWSSKPVEGAEASTIWLVPKGAKGITVEGPFTGLGLRGNESSPVTADGVVVPERARLGDDGKGFGVMMEVVLPAFSAMNAACSVGIMESSVARAAEHASSARWAHSGQSPADLATVRAYLAKMRVKTDMARALWLDTLDALSTGRADAMLRVLECKAACNDAAIEVTDLAMRVSGGAAFRGDVGVERYFRDARAGAVMAPTSDALYDFIGKAVCNMPLFG